MLTLRRLEIWFSAEATLMAFTAVCAFSTTLMFGPRLLLPATSFTAAMNASVLVLYWKADAANTPRVKVSKTTPIAK